MRQDSFKNELDWLAFCYIADELDDAQRDGFELLLARDQTARDAVVQAMESAQLIQSALEFANAGEPKSSPGKSKSADAITGASAWRSRRLRGQFVAIAAACLLVLTCGWMWYSHSQVASLESSLAFEITPSELDEASAWAFTLSELDSEEMETLAEQETGFTDVVYKATEDWMLVALTDLGTETEAALAGDKD